MLKIKKTLLFRAVFCLVVFLLVLTVTGTSVALTYETTVNEFLGIQQSQTSEGTGEVLYDCSYDNLDDLLDAKRQIIAETEGEGAVLLKNNGALPLAEGSKVSLFGRTTVDPIYGGTGSGSVDTTIATDLVTALEGVYEVNEELLAFYRASDLVRIAGRDTFVAEVPYSEYTAAVKNSYAQYSDAAIVTIGRIGGEGSDLITGEYADGVNYLMLNDDEKSVLENVCREFETVIVLLNTMNAMETDWLDEYDIDACLWIGGIGLSGSQGVADILCGKINPSGRLADTYAADPMSAPAMQNQGSFEFTNSAEVTRRTGFSKSNNYYLVQQEGIYVGYRYYETRYYDCVTGSGNAASATGAYASESGWNYADEVVFPFGYGLSYTTFTQTLDEVTVNETTIDIKVTVKNTGETAGKEVVQVYVQSPYTQYDIDNGIEKSAVQLVGFAKTELLQPQDERQVTISVDKSDFAIYEAKGYKTYIMEGGEYFLAIGTDAHDALNNIIAAQGLEGDAAGNASMAYGWEEEADYQTYSKSKTGEKITNQFDDVSLGYWGTDVKMLTRSDWQGSYPSPQAGLAATDEMIARFMPNAGYTAGSSDTSSIVTGADNDVRLYDLIGADFDDERWEKLLDQLTTDEMAQSIGVTIHTIQAMNSVGSPPFVSYDGPAGITAVIPETKDRTQYEKSLQGGGFNIATVLACTWNEEFIERVGTVMGDEGLYIDVDGVYGPAANIHRSPYSGRNFEYFSEDPFLSGKIGAAEVKGLQSKGIIPFVKHFAVNDCETNREGLSTFATEQSIREISLKGFQDIFEEGKALAVMNGLNRVGCDWTGHSYAMMTQVLRNEWGFEGFVDTDMAMSNPYMTYKNGLAAGTDTWLSSTTSTVTDQLAVDLKSDVTLLGYARQSVHRILYVIANSAAMNGVSRDSAFATGGEWWKAALYAIDAVLGCAALAVTGIIIWKEVFRKKERRDENRV